MTIFHPNITQDDEIFIATSQNVSTTTTLNTTFYNDVQQVKRVMETVLMGGEPKQVDVAKVVNYLVSNQQYVNSRATRVKSKAAPGKSKEDWASTNIRICVYCARYLTPAALELLENDFQSLKEGQDSILTQDFMYNKAKVCSTQHTADFQVGLMKRYQRLKTAGKRAVYQKNTRTTRTG